MDTSRAPTASIEQRKKWCLRGGVTLSESFTASWNWVSDSILLQWPLASIMVCVGVCVVLSSRLTDIEDGGASNLTQWPIKINWNLKVDPTATLLSQVVYDINSTLGSSSLESRRDELYVKQLFPSSPRFSHLLFTAPEVDNNSYYEEDTNVLMKVIFDDIWDVAEKVARIEAGPNNDTYETLCYRHSTQAPCAPFGVLSFWNRDPALYRTAVADSQSLRVALSEQTFLDGTPVPRDITFGNYTLVKDGPSDEEILKYAGGVMVTYALLENVENAETVLEWEQSFLRLAAEMKLSSSRMFWKAAMSSENEQKTGLHGWGCLAITVSVLTMAIASSYFLGSPALAETPSARMTLGLVGIILLVISTAAAGGALAMGGVPVSGVHSAFLPLVCLAVGLQNMFGLCAELDGSPRDVPARHRVGGAASQWAPGAVLVATLSASVMCVGASVFSSSATRNFCIFAGAGILLGWATQVFGLIPFLLFDERRRDAARQGFIDQLKGPPYPDQVIDQPQQVRSRRDSFEVETLPNSCYQCPTKENAGNVVGVWEDTGDEQSPTPLGSPVSNSLHSVKGKAPHQTPSPWTHPESKKTRPRYQRRLLECWIRREDEKTAEQVNPTAKLRGGKRGNDCEHDPRQQRRLPDKSVTHGARRVDCHPFSSAKGLGHLGVGAEARPFLRRLQEVALVKRFMGCSSSVEGSKCLRGGGKGHKTGARREWGFDGQMVQGYCNWLLDDSNPRRRILAGFGGMLVAAIAITLIHGSPGYNLIDVYPRSSYLRDFEVTARQHGMLLGENSLSVAAYVRGVNLFSPVIQKAVIDLEDELVSSSPLTISSTSSVIQDAISPGHAESSWLRGFLDWLPSSSYVSEITEQRDEEALWVGSADLFYESLNNFISEPGYQSFHEMWICKPATCNIGYLGDIHGSDILLHGNDPATVDAMEAVVFEDDLSFDGEQLAACRIWARHLDFRGATAVATMKAAKDAVDEVEMEPSPFVFAREYIYVEGLASVVREVYVCLMAVVFSTAVIGYLFLQNLALVFILTFVVEALALIVLQNAGDSGLSAYTLTPPLFLSAALGAGYAGTILKSVVSQDGSERPFRTILRISVTGASGPMCSASAVVSVGMLLLLVLSASSPSATHSIQIMAISTLWATLLSLSHGLLLAPTLLLLCGDRLTVGPNSPRPRVTESEAETLPWIPPSCLEKNTDLFGDRYSLSIGRAGAVAMLDCEDGDTSIGGGAGGGNDWKKFGISE